jgi:hypothetical protein
LFVVMGFALVLAVWLAWALIALPIAGIARLRHNEPLAARMVRSPAWNLTGKR